MTNLKKVEFFLAINSEGDVVVNIESTNDAVDSLLDDYGNTEGMACYHLVAMIPLPCPVTIDAGTFPATVARPPQHVEVSEAHPCPAGWDRVEGGPST
jgi:hypothetical protein